MTNAKNPDPLNCLLLSACGPQKRVAARYLLVDEPAVLDAFLSARMPDAIRPQAIRGLTRLATARDSFLAALGEVRGSPRRRLSWAIQAQGFVDDPDSKASDELAAASAALLELSVLPEPFPSSPQENTDEGFTSLKWLAYSGAAAAASLLLVAIAVVRLVH